MRHEVVAFVQNYWGVIGATATASYAAWRNFKILRNIIGAFISPIATGWRLTEYERRSADLLERGEYWQNSHADLLERYNDLERRFIDGLKDLRELRREEQRRAELIRALGVDYEAAHQWAVTLRDQLLELGAKPKAEEPTWLSTGYNVLLQTKRFAEK